MVRVDDVVVIYKRFIKHFHGGGEGGEGRQGSLDVFVFCFVLILRTDP